MDLSIQYGLVKSKSPPTPLEKKGGLRRHPITYGTFSKQPHPPAPRPAKSGAGEIFYRGFFRPSSGEKTTPAKNQGDQGVFGAACGTENSHNLSHPSPIYGEPASRARGGRCTYGLVHPARTGLAPLSLRGVGGIRYLSTLFDGEPSNKVLKKSPPSRFWPAPGCLAQVDGAGGGATSSVCLVIP